MPKGERYDILHDGLSQYDKIGFVVMPIGEEFYNYRRYFNFLANPDWNRSQVVYDEKGVLTNVPSQE